MSAAQLKKIDQTLSKLLEKQNTPKEKETSVGLTLNHIVTAVAIVITSVLGFFVYDFKADIREMRLTQREEAEAERIARATAAQANFDTLTKMVNDKLAGQEKVLVSAINTGIADLKNTLTGPEGEVHAMLDNLDIPSNTDITAQINALRSELISPDGFLLSEINSLDKTLVGSEKEWGNKYTALNSQVGDLKALSASLFSSQDALQSTVEDITQPFAQIQEGLATAKVEREQAMRLAGEAEQRLAQKALETEELNASIKATIAAASLAFSQQKQETQGLLDQISTAVREAENRDVEREEQVKQNVRETRALLERYCRDRAFSDSSPISTLADNAALSEEAQKGLAVLSGMAEDVIGVSPACERLWIVVRFPGSILPERKGTIEDFAKEIQAEVVYGKEEPFRLGGN